MCSFYTPVFDSWYFHHFSKNTEIAISLIYSFKMQFFYAKTPGNSGFWCYSHFYPHWLASISSHNLEMQKKNNNFNPLRGIMHWKEVLIRITFSIFFLIHHYHIPRYRLLELSRRYRKTEFMPFLLPSVMALQNLYPF